ALRKAFSSNFDTYLEKGQIEIVSNSSVYANKEFPDFERTTSCLVEKHDQAIETGYDGLRLSGDLYWLQKKNWEVCLNFEKAIDKVIGDSRILALCRYPLDKCSATEIIDITTNHQFSLVKKEGKWKQLESPRYKKAESKINNLLNIVKFSGDAILTYSPDGIITSWNKGAEKVYGYLAEEILGKPISILEPNMLFEETQELIELIKQGDTIHHYETFRLTKEGTIIKVLLNISPVFDASGKLTDILVIAKDITKQKRIEEKLQRSEERYRVAAEQTGRVVYEYDLRTNKSSWEGAIEEVTGYTFEEFQKLGKDIWIENIHFAGHADRTPQKNRMNGNRFKEELRLRKKDGTWIYVENNGIWLTDCEGKRYGAIGELKDITEQKCAIEKIEASERKYRSFVQNFHGIALQFDENFNPVFLHGAVEEITGYSDEDLMFQISWKDVIYPDDLPLVLKDMEKIRNSPASAYEEIEFRIRRRDGSIRCISFTCQKILGKNGNPDLYQGMMHDVTEKKETEDLLVNIETARKKEIHHRIKNNLQVISSLLDLQAEKFSNREYVQDSEILEAFRQSQDRILSIALIHEQLYEGRGNDTLNFSQYLERLVEKLFQTYKCGNADIRLYTDLEKDILFDMSTAVPLGMIVNELVSNSLKYAFTGRSNGILQIKLYRDGHQENKENAVQNTEGLESVSYALSVSDNGIGLPEGFDLENSQSLGIQLINALAKQLKGTIELNEENGTEFIIRFKVVKKSKRKKRRYHKRNPGKNIHESKMKKETAIAS
ncbi:MAG TPA: PAS domain S-box protein, partial [Methanosarcina sp.]|nr:PAS domain S-box protein [Methanosarcina sp.]